jgi:hypothetical protein
MTHTATWLERHRAALTGRRRAAAVLTTLAVLLTGVGVGVWLARVGTYQAFPAAAMMVWVVTLALVGTVSWRAMRHAARSLAELATVVEREGGLRQGAMSGLAGSAVGSGALLEVADRKAFDWLAQHGDQVLAPEWRAARRSMRRAWGACAAGAVVLLGAAPLSPRVAAFWHPLALLTMGEGPVRLSVDRTQVPRGDAVTVRIEAAGRRGATLYERAPGEPWRASTVALDSLGVAERRVGPLDADRFFRAVSGGRGSDTLHVRVAMSLFLLELSLDARYPAYQERPDEPLAVGPDTLYLPVGTRITARGRVSVPLTSAMARREPGPRTALDTDGAAFSGSWTVTVSGTWRLGLTGPDGAAVEPGPAIHVVAVPDRPPEVRLPVPGADTTAPVSLRVPLVIDVQDDFRVRRVEVVTRRVTRLGNPGGVVVDTVPLPERGVERAVLPFTVDLNQYGYLPGDTAFVRARAMDNAPAGQVSETREYALRLLTLAELRDQARQDARDLVQAGDSVARAQQELIRATEDLTAGRRPEAAGARQGQGGEPLSFRQAEQAQEIAEQQSRLAARASELSEQVRELSQSAWAAGLTDPEWHRQLEELQDLLRRAVTPELERALEALRASMQRLDELGVREALERLAEAQRRLRAEMERSRTLFERAALEGELTSLAADADDLAQAQREWNRTAAQRIDTALARRERDLAQDAGALAEALGHLQRNMEQAGAAADAARQAEQRAVTAGGHMREAAEGAAGNRQAQAVGEGQRASAQLDPIGEQLREQRERLRDDWRAEVLAAMDQALVEAAQLALRQEALHQRLRSGDYGPEYRAQQGAVRDGVDRVIQRLQGAAGRHALVSPRLGFVLGISRQSMSNALGRLQTSAPNLRAATADTEQALDALNAVVHEILRGRSDVASAQSGSGMAEAIERMAQLAGQQNALAGETGGVLPLMQAGGEALMAELRALAQRQRHLAQELDRLRAEGGGDGTGALADEARELARQLEAGAVDRQTVDRQERLYRRLLDQGRTLRGSEEDERAERQAEAAREGTTYIPQARPADTGPRYRYPSWEELQRVSPEERRLILDYFRRLNEARERP